MKFLENTVQWNQWFLWFKFFSFVVQFYQQSARVFEENFNAIGLLAFLDKNKVTKSPIKLNYK